MISLHATVQFSNLEVTFFITDMVMSNCTSFQVVKQGFSNHIKIHRINAKK